jgi:phosphatidylglycerol:prolipoprotein diacylglycerol transferase
MYPLLMTVALVSCAVLLRRFQIRLELTTKQKTLIGIAAFVGAMIGAKLPFLISDWFLQNGDANPFAGVFSSAWLADGKTIMFGIVGGYAAVEIAKKVLGVSVRTGDSFAVPVAVGVAIGRLACFSVGCCHGIETTLPWGVHFQAVDAEVIYRHPTQIYETLFHALFALAMFFSYRFLYRKNCIPPTRFDVLFYGNLIKVYIISYLIYRLLSEEIRPEPELVGGLTAYQVTAAILIPIFLVIWVLDVSARLQRLQLQKRNRNVHESRQ